MLLYIELMGAPSNNNNIIIREMGHHPILLSPDHRKLLLGFARLDTTLCTICSSGFCTTTSCLLAILRRPTHSYIMCGTQSILSLAAVWSGRQAGWWVGLAGGAMVAIKSSFLSVYCAVMCFCCCCRAQTSTRTCV